MSHSSRQVQPLRVAIDAQVLRREGTGGVENAIIGLIRALGQLDDGPEEYVIIGPPGGSEWLKPITGPNQRIVERQGAPQRHMTRVPSPLRPVARRASDFINQFLGVRSQAPISDGLYENLECDVVHFPHQGYTICALPTIYNPHDLQHLYFPQFFTPEAIAIRETVFRTGCQLAHTIVVATEWVKADVVRHFGVDAGKVQVIPWAPPTEVYPDPTPEELSAVKSRYNLESPFALYPAITWGHKNHLRLLEALAHLRDEHNLVIRLVCTGEKYPGFWNRIEEQLRVLNLGSQVQFVGRVPGADLRAIYRAAQFVVVPTLFEAASGPVFEAWYEEVPVACSTVTSLPEQVGDAALLFDPYAVEAIAQALLRMTTEEDLRRELVHRGRWRLQDFSWTRTAKAYRAVYRRAARCALTEEDQYLLRWDWARHPELTSGETL